MSILIISKDDGYKMIGNAVSVKMACIIAEEILDGQTEILMLKCNSKFHFEGWGFYF